jgi:cytochrome c nitrite reductase small subunit
MWGIRGTLLTVTVITAGILIGAGTYTFWFAQGYSYLLDDPEACVNCHVMRENFQSWMRSSHHGVTCNECHVPHTFFRKWLSKAENGFNHSVAFTFGAPDAIRAKPRAHRVLQENCFQCHATAVAFVRGRHDEQMSCFECHQAVGHAF